MKHEYSISSLVIQSVMKYNVGLPIYFFLLPLTAQYLSIPFLRLRLLHQNERLKSAKVLICLRLIFIAEEAME